MMKKQQGLTMIEILVAILILAIGLLGTASMQVRSVQDTGNSNLRSMAIYLANDMADRIRANRTGLEAGNYDDETGDADNTSTCLASGGCSASAMAAHDKWEWLGNVSGSLPGGVGAIDRVGNLFSITVSWDERVTQQSGNAIVQGSINLTFEP